MFVQISTSLFISGASKIPLNISLGAGLYKTCAYQLGEGRRARARLTFVSASSFFLNITTRRYACFKFSKRFAPSSLEYKAS